MERTIVFTQKLTTGVCGDVVGTIQGSYTTGTRDGTTLAKVILTGRYIGRTVLAAQGFSLRYHKARALIWLAGQVHELKPAEFEEI